MKNMKFILWACSGLILAACSPHSFDDTSTLALALAHEDSTSIIGGSPIHERSSQAAQSVVLIEMTNRFGYALGFCTGTLIDTQTVLTAGHCFDETNISGLAGFNVIFTNKYEVFFRSTSRRGRAYRRHSDYNSTTHFDHDIAIGTFEGGIPEGYSPVSIDTNTKATYSNKKVYVYGFGRSQDYTGRRNEDLSAYLGQLHRGVMKVDDNYGRFKDRYWLNSEVPVFICQGDSGGPQFYHEDGKLKVIGINSAVYGTKLPNGRTSCKGRAQATKVAPFAAWISSTRKKLSAETYH